MLKFVTMGIIKKQGIQNTIVTYIGISLGFLNLIIIQPYFLSTEEIGLTRVLFSISSLIAVLLPLGVGHITIKYFPTFRSPEKKHNGFFGFMLIFPIIGFLLTSIILFTNKAFFIEQYSDNSPLLIDFFSYIFPFSFFLGFINVLNIYCFSLFKTTIPSFLHDVVSRVLTIILIGVYYTNIIDLKSFIFCFVLIYGLQLILLAIYIFKVDSPGFIFSFEFIKKHNFNAIVSFGALLSLASIASLGLKYLDSIMIAKYLPLSAVGIYSIAAFIPTVIEAPLFSLDKIAGAKIAHAITHNDREEIQKIYYKSSKYMLIVGGLLFVGINANISDLLSMLPDEYAGGINVVFIISLGTLFTMLSGANTNIIFNSDKYVFGAFLLIFLAISAFVLNVLLIPIMGIEGAALATALAALIYNLVKYLYIWKHFDLQPFNLNTLWIILLTFACLVLGFALPSLFNPLFSMAYRSVLLTLVYALIIIVFKFEPEINKQLQSLKDKYL